MQKTNEEVSGQVSENNTEGQLDVASAEKYVSFAEAKEQVAQLKGNSVYGYTFSDKFEMPEMDSISLIKLKQYRLDDTSSVEQVLSNVWNDYNTLDWSKIEEKIYTISGDEKYIGINKHAETGCWFSCDTYGFLCGCSLEDSNQDEYGLKKAYDFQITDDYETVKSDKYMLNDGETTIGDAVTYVEDRLNEYLAPLENSVFQYKVQKLKVKFNTTTETCRFDMIIGKVYNEIDVLTAAGFNLNPGYCYEYVHTGDRILVTMGSVNKIDNINNCSEALAIANVDEKDNIISPFWAVEQMNKEIANNGGVSYKYCGLVYVITQENDKYEAKEQGSYDGVNDENTYLRPYWIFADKASGSAWSASSGDVLEHPILIDAIDGTLYYYDITGVY